MLITFRALAYHDVTLFGEAALTLIKLMGRRDTVPSAMEPENIPNALKLLRAGIAADAAAASEGQVAEPNDDIDETVRLHQRALPLIELLQAAYEEGVPVMWEEVGTNAGTQ